MTMDELEVGTRVRVIRNVTGHGFQIGEEVEVTRFDEEGDPRFAINDFTAEWCMSPMDYAPIETKYDFACAECGRQDAETYVVSTLDYDDVRHTRTEVCLSCHNILNDIA